jgi:hypothetical protein
MSTQLLIPPRSYQLCQNGGIIIWGKQRKGAMGNVRRMKGDRRIVVGQQFSAERRYLVMKKQSVLLWQHLEKKKSSMQN